jgi:hypothetical protein
MVMKPFLIWLTLALWVFVIGMMIYSGLMDQKTHTEITSTPWLTDQMDKACIDVNGIRQGEGDCR